VSHYQKSPPHRIKNQAYRQAFERLDAALEENTRPDPDEIGRILRGEPTRMELRAESSFQNNEVYPGKSDQIRP
jgi:hypothetical protein